ncbi:DUF6636 domain-containing protein [Arcanobacterium canis]
MSVNDFFKNAPESDTPMPPHSTDPHPHSMGSLTAAVMTGKRPLYLLIGAAALLVLVITLVFSMVIFQGRNLAGSAQEPRPSITDHVSASPPPQSTDSESNHPIPVDTPASIAEHTGCDSPAADAEKLSAYVSYVATEGTWNDDMKNSVTAALKDIDSHCPKSYSLSLLGALAESQIAPQLNALAANGAWITPARPLPQGGIEATNFTSPAKNIHCALSGENLMCSINVYDYPSTPSSCEGKTQTYTLTPKGEISEGCQTKVTATKVLDYGNSVSVKGYGCTVEKDGVTCWNALSGKGFTLKRASENLF